MKERFYTQWHMQTDEDRRSRIMRATVTLVVSETPPIMMAVQVSANWDGNPLQQAKMAGLAVEKGQRMLAGWYEENVRKDPQCPKCRCKDIINCTFDHMKVQFGRYSFEPKAGMECSECKKCGHHWEYKKCESQSQS